MMPIQNGLTDETEMQCIARSSCVRMHFDYMNLHKRGQAIIWWA